MKKNDIIVHPANDEELNAIKAFMKALNISYDISTKNQYDPEFVAKIKESRKQVREGKTVSMDLDDIWKE